MKIILEGFSVELWDFYSVDNKLSYKYKIIYEDRCDLDWGEASSLPEAEQAIMESMRRIQKQLSNSLEKLEASATN